MSDEKLPAPGWDDDLLSGLSEFIELVRSGEFYKDYDASMELLGKADAALKALRRTAPPDSGAGKSEPTNKATNNFIRDAFCNLKEHELREAIKIICKNMPPPDPSAMPDHVGATHWRPISPRSRTVSY